MIKKIVAMLLLMPLVLSAETFTWTAVTKDLDGKAVTVDKYRVYCDGQTTRETTTNTLTVQLPQGQVLKCRVAAVSAAGEGPPTDTLGFLSLNGSLYGLNVPAAPAGFAVK